MSGRDNQPPVIIIDPGHGGDDPGATRFGLRESELNLEVGKRLAMALHEDFTVQMTRSEDWTTSFTARTMNTPKADLFVSIHHNSAENEAAHGIETFCHINADLPNIRLAERVQKTLCDALPVHDRGMKKADFRVLRDARCTAVLIEVGFVSNASEARRVARTDCQEVAAQAIATAIREWFWEGGK